MNNNKYNKNIINALILIINNTEKLPQCGKLRTNIIDQIQSSNQYSVSLYQNNLHGLCNNACYVRTILLEKTLIAIIISLSSLSISLTINTNNEIITNILMIYAQLVSIF